MDGRWKRRSWSFVAVAAFCLAGSPAGPDDRLTTARLTRRGERFAVARAIRGAVRLLGHSECQGLVDEFSDASGRPLRVTLEAQAVEVGGYLDRVFFYDAPEALCGTSNLAITHPGSHAVFVCGSNFVSEMTRNSRHAEAAIIHEMLHSLGLGENPPSSEHITSRVLTRCRQRGEVPSARATPPPPLATTVAGRTTASQLAPP
jgi:hypothetical protein